MMISEPVVNVLANAYDFVVSRPEAKCPTLDSRSHGIEERLGDLFRLTDMTRQNLFLKLLKHGLAMFLGNTVPKRGLDRAGIDDVDTDGCKVNGE